MQADFFARKRRNTLGFLLVLGLITLGAILITEYNIVRGFESFPRAVIWALGNFYPTQESLSRLPGILNSLIETLLVSIAATTLGAMFALLFAVLGSNTTRVNAFFGSICRGIATVFRNIDVAAWAMILLFSFGQSSLTGYFALFFASFGFLTRSFVETIDEVSGGSVEALRATGASYFSIIAQSVVPSSLPQMISWVLFMIETNVRSATLIGLLTGSGIGFTFNLYYKNLNYDIAALVVIAIVVAILLIEAVSNYVRRVIL
ncbi:PhnE/PtxC family ABC transporter permease [Halalkalibacter oceani]|uniref:ABC transporter permease subunit n=1 Tax=Halalkalibacter oceani TaxID=1653776 RepID=A0A9X2DPP3_9BACI|nr:ABC transporter permease subunit [Halalkalibacter oceani]MCM3714391.1 ABC transporter permease subunit [Halalkalibacter oceani]